MPWPVSATSTKRWLHLRGHVHGDFHEEIVDLGDGSSIELPHMACNEVTRWQGDRIVSWSAKALAPYSGDAAIEICAFDLGAHLIGHASTRAAWYVETGTELEVQLTGGFDFARPRFGARERGSSKWLTVAAHP